jgi:hypothetical protein
MVSFPDLAGAPQLFTDAFGQRLGRLLWRLFFVLILITAVSACLIEIEAFEEAMGPGITSFFGRNYTLVHDAVAERLKPRPTPQIDGLGAAEQLRPPPEQEPPLLTGPPLVKGPLPPVAPPVPYVAGGQ